MKYHCIIKLANLTLHLQTVLNQQIQNHIALEIRVIFHPIIPVLFMEVADNFINTNPGNVSTISCGQRCFFVGCSKLINIS